MSDPKESIKLKLFCDLEEFVLICWGRCNVQPLQVLPRQSDYVSLTIINLDLAIQNFTWKQKECANLCAVCTSVCVCDGHINYAFAYIWFARFKVPSYFGLLNRIKSWMFAYDKLADCNFKLPFAPAIPYRIYRLMYLPAKSNWTVYHSEFNPSIETKRKWTKPSCRFGYRISDLFAHWAPFLWKLYMCATMSEGKTTIRPSQSAVNGKCTRTQYGNKTGVLCSSHYW